MQFPTVTGSNLQRQKRVLPQDFGGDVNLVLIAFQRWQQSQLAAWLHFARRLEKDHACLRYYELPVIRRMNFLSRGFIDGGMRAGISDPVTRERTITLYLDKAEFRDALQLPGEDNIHILLVNRDGKILWREEGIFAPEKGDSLIAVVQEACQG